MKKQLVHRWSKRNIWSYIVWKIIFLWILGVHYDRHIGDLSLKHQYICMYTSFWHLTSNKYSKTIWILSLLVTFFCFLIYFYLTGFFSSPFSIKKRSTKNSKCILYRNPIHFNLKRMRLKWLLHHNKVLLQCI